MTAERAAVERRSRSLDSHEARIRSLEDRALLADHLHEGYEAADSRTALAIEALAKTINDPRDGLIRELADFRSEVRSDRQTFKAWIAGATAVLGVVFALVTAVAPYLQKLVGAHP